MMQNRSLNNKVFWDSLHEHQVFVDFLLANVNEDGYIYLSRMRMSEHLVKSPTLIAQYIKRLNRVDMCVVKIMPGVYKLNYSNLNKDGIFPVIYESLKIINLILPDYLKLNYKQKSELLEVPVSIIPVIEGYLYTDSYKSI